MKRRRVAHVAPALAAVIALATLGGCVPSDLAPLTFPAQYQFMGDAGAYPPAPDCARYGTLVIENARPDDGTAGVRYLQEGGSRYDVTMEGDVEAWLRAGVEQAFRQAAITDGGSGTVTVRLETISAEESVYRRSEYDGTVVIEAEVDGYSTVQKGFAENYGYTGSALNYQETVNHALDRALAELVSDRGFLDALCR